MSTIKLQVPIDKNVRIALENRAHSLGFDSAQAYIRVWAKAEVEGRTLEFGEKAVMLSPKANLSYARMITELEDEKKNGKVKEFNNVNDFMKDLIA